MPGAYVLIHRLFQFVMYQCRDRVYRCIEYFVFHVLMHDSYASMHTEQKGFVIYLMLYVSMQRLYVSMLTDIKCILIVI